MGRDRRKKKSRPFVMLPHEMLDSPRWKALSFSAQALYVRLRRKYKKYNNGEIYLPYSELSDEFAKGTIAKGFKALLAAGIIGIQKHGGLHREYCLYQIVENWWVDQTQPHFLRHSALKNGTSADKASPPHVQKIGLSPYAGQNTTADQKIGPYLESTTLLGGKQDGND